MQTTTMGDTAGTVDEVIAALRAPLRALDDDLASLPRAKGLYAWWVASGALPDLPGLPHPVHGSVRTLYVGLAANLRARITRNHMRRSGSSTLRRTLAGLLLAEQGLRTRWTDRVVLVDDDELRLTDWMREHLLLSYCENDDPRLVEAEAIRRLRPPLNIDHASGPVRDTVRSARSRFYASAGLRPSK
jgi:hypothetical protein